MKWYKHDANANSDAKMKRLRLRYGMEGYGLYWYCLELIAANVDDNNLTFELEHDSELISADTGIHRERVEEMMVFMVEQGLFEQAPNGVITCLKMAKRTDEYTQKLLRRISNEGGENGHYLELLRTQSGEAPEKVPPIRTEQNRTDKYKSEISEIFDFWRETMGKANNTKLTSDRRSKIRARLNDGYSVDEIKRAIKNCRASRFHMGENDGGKIHNDLELICRNGSKLEGFRDMKPEPKQGAASEGLSL